jgi:hypothetical protein
LRIHDILGWIRIWIRGSILLTNGSRSGCRSCYFRHWPSQNANKKLITKIFLLITSWRYMYIIFKDKKQSKRSHKAEGINVFLTFLLGDRRIQIGIRIHTSDWWIRIWIQEPQKHVDPDSDPTATLVKSIRESAIKQLWIKEGRNKKIENRKDIQDN